jgi:hypothetical protein
VKKIDIKGVLGEIFKASQQSFGPKHILTLYICLYMQSIHAESGKIILAQLSRALKQQ